MDVRQSVISKLNSVNSHRDTVQFNSEEVKYICKIFSQMHTKSKILSIEESGDYSLELKFNTEKTLH